MTPVARLKSKQGITLCKLNANMKVYRLARTFAWEPDYSSTFSALSPTDLSHQEDNWRASLVAQWLRIRLPMQGTRVRALVWEDPTCRGATGPVSHNY